MNYKTYAKALFESFLEKSESEFDSFFENFIATLKNKNKISLLPKILNEVKKYFELAKKQDITEIILKDKKDLEKFKDKLNEMSDKFNLDDLKITENKNIVGGFILKNSRYIWDKSYKEGLLKLYKKLIK